MYRQYSLENGGLITEFVRTGRPTQGVEEVCSGVELCSIVHVFGNYEGHELRI